MYYLIICDTYIHKIVTNWRRKNEEEEGGKQASYGRKQQRINVDIYWYDIKVIKCCAIAIASKNKSEMIKMPGIKEII